MFLNKSMPKKGGWKQGLTVKVIKMSLGHQKFGFILANLVSFQEWIAENLKPSKLEGFSPETVTILSRFLTSWPVIHACHYIFSLWKNDESSSGLVLFFPVTILKDKLQECSLFCLSAWNICKINELSSRAVHTSQKLRFYFFLFYRNFCIIY